jgi:hypothetical protein
VSQWPPPASPRQPYFQPPERRTNGMAIAALICGIIGCIPILPPLAILFGFLGIRKARDPRYGMNAAAIAGVVLGLLWILIWAGAGSAGLAFWRGSAPPRDATKAFIADLAAGNTAAATAKTTGISPAEIQSLVTRLAGQGPVKDVTALGITMNNTNGKIDAAVGGQIMMDGNHAHTFAASLLKSGETYKINGFTLDSTSTGTMSQPNPARRARGAAASAPTTDE